MNSSDLASTSTPAKVNATSRSAPAAPQINVGQRERLFGYVLLLPTLAVANLTWVPLDFSLVDLVGTGGGPILMFEGDYDGPLGMLITPSGGVVRATMDAALDGFAGGDADFIAAFGQTGALNALAPIANGATLCGIVHNCNANAALRDWVNWSSNPTITLQTNQVPEPGTASLIALGLLGLSLRKRTLRA